MSMKPTPEQSIQALEEERDALRRELDGTQQMLAQVLKAVGEPVVVTKESLAAGPPPGTQIKIDDRIDLDAFVFSVEERDE